LADVAILRFMGMRTEGFGFGAAILLTMMSSGSLGALKTSKDNGMVRKAQPYWHSKARHG
jgi:hypothetical protein